jgi:hypothetical protein
MVFVPEFGYEILETKDISCLHEPPFKDHRRLKVFHLKGCSCVTCGLQGEILAKGQDEKGSFHWDVYTKGFVPLTVDHITPRSRGGSNHIKNLQPMCYECNQIKGDGLDYGLATVQKVEEIKEISGADRVCAYLVNQKLAVDSVGLYQVGDPVIFITAGSWVPVKLAPPNVSRDKKPRIYKGVEGFHLKSSRFKGQTSEGIIKPFHSLFGGEIPEEGKDVSGRLRMRSYTPPQPHSKRKNGRTR